MYHKEDTVINRYRKINDLMGRYDREWEKIGLEAQSKLIPCWPVDRGNRAADGWARALTVITYVPNDNNVLSED